MQQPLGAGNLARLGLLSWFVGFVPLAMVGAQDRDQQDRDQQDRDQAWYRMDYGPVLSTTCEGWSADNVALKARAIDLGDGAWVVFDTELLRVAAAWTDGYLQLRGTPFDGSHGPIPKALGQRVSRTSQSPGWAMDQSWDDPRPIPYGPLPRDWGRFRGHYLHGNEVVLSYEVGGRSVLEKFDAIRAASGAPIGLTRTLEFGPGEAVHANLFEFDPAEDDSAPKTVMPGSSEQLPWRASSDGTAADDGEQPVTRYSGVRLIDAPSGVKVEVSDGRAVLAVPPAPGVLRVKLAVWESAEAGKSPIADLEIEPAAKLSDLTKGDERRWKETLMTRGARGDSKGAWAVDTITLPDSNPWDSRLRFAAFDFIDDESAALSTWNGDVWVVTGIDEDLNELQWQRFATGLHDPLGLKVVDGVVMTHGRDGLTKLHDLNGDGEADFYEVFNNDVLMTKAFHEFAFDLQTDAAGDFYMSKGGPVNSGGRGFEEIVPHHGTILKISRDGTELEVLATGLRAPNGISVGPDGVVTSGDNEGTWMPACRINWIREGAFCGVMDLAHRDPAPETYDDPLCWLPMSVDNSGGGQVWVTSDRFGLPVGDLLHQSYGKSAIYRVLRQHDGGRTQGGVIRLPIRVASSQMRGRFHPTDGQLYVCGFRGWQTNASKESAFQRVRYLNQDILLAEGLHIGTKTITLRFSQPVSEDTGTDPESFSVEHWNYLYSEAYGSAEYSPSDPDKKVEHGAANRDALKVISARLIDDGRAVVIEVEGLQRVMQMHISYELETADEEPLEGEIFNTVNFLGEDPAGDVR